MFPETKRSLKDFATQMNWAALGHPNDVERFWNFIIFAYRHGDHKISLDEFMAVVTLADQTKKDNANRTYLKKRLNFLIFLFGKYEDGIKLLQKFETGG